MSSQRKIAALRALAERPGTEAEGEAAKAALKRLGVSANPDQWDAFRSHLRTGLMDDLSRAVGQKTCPCGNKHPAFTQCPLTDFHDRIRQEMLQKFPRGTRAYYNEWAYADNEPCTVTGYSADWNRVRVKFDNRKTISSVAFYNDGRWLLTSDPLTDAEIYALPHGKIKRNAKAWAHERFKPHADGVK